MDRRTFLRGGLVAGVGGSRLLRLVSADAAGGRAAHRTGGEEPSPLPPSGRQMEIHLGDQHAVVTEVGGGLRSYTVGPREVLDGYAAGEMCPGSRGQCLLPWPNRTRDGAYTFRGAAQQLALTEPTRGHAIHGLVRWLSWHPLEHEADRVTMGLLLHPQPGYPFLLDLSADYRLSAEGLTVTVTARNRGPGPLPYAAGHHPYLTVGTEVVDTAELRLPAASRLELDARSIPTGRSLEVEGTPYDFRSGRPVGGLRLDDCFTDLAVASDGVTRVALRDPRSEAAVTVWMDRSHRWVMVFSGDTLQDAGRRRRGLAIEPMTCPPNALQTGVGLCVLEPEEAITTRWGITPGGSPGAAG
jgi:aldose 1-epimerase